MLAIFKREITSFFTSPIAYLMIGLFLTFTGLFLWVFRANYNIFDYGFADISNFFLLAPWIFLFLIPAITMKSFSEERRHGTIELLLIKPISLIQIIIGKFLASMVLVLIAILPTFLYAFTIGQLGITPWNLDLGLAIGSYTGLFFLVANYTAIGIFASTITDNQVVAFLGGLMICFIFYYGFEALSTLFSQGDLVLYIRGMGMKVRAENMAGGILDTRDVIYFLSFTCFFLFLSVLKLKTLKR